MKELSVNKIMVAIIFIGIILSITINPPVIGICLILFGFWVLLCGLLE